MTVKLIQIYQPKNPVFWLMVVLNLLSLLLAWLTRNYPLNVMASLVVVGFSIGNALLGTYLAWRLVSTPAVAPI